MSSSGPPGLGTLLIQRLDAALGMTLGQQTMLVAGARPNAVMQPGIAAGAGAPENPVSRHPRESVDKALGPEQSGAQRSRGNAELQVNAARSLPSFASLSADNGATPSAPTTLGHTARAILALLHAFPGKAPAIQGRTPLLPAGTFLQNTLASGSPANVSGGQANQASTTPTAGSQNTAQQGVPLQSSTASNTVLPEQLGRAPNGAPAMPISQAATAHSGRAGALPALIHVSAALPAPSSSPLAMAFSSALAQAIQTSGLFYESHLGEASFGRQSVESLRQEPQANLARAAEAGTQTTASRAPASPEGTPSQTPTTTSSLSLSGIHPETHLLVRQQLETLANQSLAWRGEAWPDAPMEWQIEHPPGSHGSTIDEPDTHWSTQITIELPRLGNVQARLSLNDSEIVMRIVAPQSADLLRQDTATLREGFSGAGLILSGVSILHAEQAQTAAGQHSDPIPPDTAN